MHPLVKEFNEKRIAAGLNMSEATRLIGVSSSALHYWIKGTREVREKSLKKIEEGIKLLDKGETEEAKPFRHKKTGYKELPDNLKPSTRIMYEYIYLIEDRYDSIIECPPNAPELIELHEKIGVKNYKKPVYSKKKINEIRIRKGLTIYDISLGIGRSRQWFKNATRITTENAQRIANFLQVDMKELEADG